MSNIFSYSSWTSEMLYVLEFYWNENKYVFGNKMFKGIYVGVMGSYLMALRLSLYHKT